MDCTAKCRLSYHADVVLSAVTREGLQDLQYFVKYFCGNGAQTRDRFGRNALHIAASCGRKDVLKWLLEEKLFDVNEKDFESGWTALHRACYYGHLSCALLLLQHGANIYEKDFEGLTAVEMLMLDCPRLYISQSPDAYLDVYSWGRNSNFTLGHGDDKERNIPEVVDVFTRMLHVSIKEVVLCKFHAVFLANNGSVWTCGHGLGGRLGHGDEKTILVPTKVDGLNDQMCCGIAAGQDHTVVLCENGNVFTFGLNKYHQLGHHPPASQYLSPKPVLTKTLKGKKFIGVAAGKFHTIMFTESEVYSWGLNAGQLGHIKGDRTQVSPRQISGLYLKNTSILAVNCCDAATVFLTSHGDVYLAYQYTLRRIISKLPNIKKLVVTGGRLDDNHFKELKVVKFGVLTVYGLYGDGYVFQWRENDKCLRDCRWSIKKPLSIRDIACGKSLHMVTEQGEVYTEDGTNASVKKPVKISIRSDNVIKTNHQAIKQDEVIEIPLSRVRHCHRAVRIVCDKYSQNVAILQVVPSFGCSVIPHVSPPEMKENMRRLLDDAPESHDVKIQVKEKAIHAHQVILAQSSEKFQTLMNESQSSHLPVISLDEEDFEIINEVVEFLYTGYCTSLSELDGENCELEKELTDEDILDELTLSVHDLDIDLLHAAFSEPRVVKQENNSRRFKKSRRDVENKEEWRKANNDHCSKELSEKRKELLRVAKKYRITELISRLQDSSDGHGLKPRSFHRNKLSDYCDVVIEAEDGVDFSCHKCILVSRLEYFSMMLTTGWMESSEEFLYLKMPSRVLKVIIEFLYTDEAPSVEDSKDLEFLGTVLSFADQFLIVRLREMCEARLASLISLKNAVEMLEFSCVYNAENLKSVCLEFLCMNISCVFEAGSLEMLSEDVLDEVSKAYREMIPRVSYRVITPNDIHLSVPRPQPESPKSKRKSSRSQRRSRTSESDVTEERAVQETGTKISEPAEEKIKAAEKLSENQQNDVCLHDELALENKSENISSSPDVILDQKKKSENTGLCYQKPRDDCSKFFSPLLAAKEVQKTASNSLSTGCRNDDKPDEKQPWGSPSPESSNLRAIMEQQQSKVQPNKPKKEGKSPLSNKTRLSQKERKKMRRSFEEQETVVNNACEPEQNGHNIATSPVNPWNNFSPSSKPTVSFRALLEEEKKLGTNVSSTKKKTVKQNLFVSDEKCKTPSAWQHGNIACSPPNDSNMKFDKIQELQEEETAKRERDMKKPLSLIQIEDKAIEQLIEHYGGKYNPCEYIVVKRETRTAGSPDWVK